ncbi:MAG: hypothetical protein ACFCAD_00360 [Pleurocapsa sp.]
MSNLKTALDNGDDDLVVKLTDSVQEIAKVARGSKTRIRSATRVFALNKSVEGDARIAKWTKRKSVESVMRGLLDVVREHEEVDRFCDLLGEKLLEGIRFSTWSWCVETLLWMRVPKALVYVLDAAEASFHGSPGTINLLARGGDINYEAERIKRYLNRWKNTDMFDQATNDWILAKLGNKFAYNSLVELCLHGSMDADNAMRAAQALSHINQWDAPWGKEGTEIVRAKLQEKENCS